MCKIISLYTIKTYFSFKIKLGLKNQLLMDLEKGNIIQNDYYAKSKEYKLPCALFCLVKISLCVDQNGTFAIYLLHILY